MNTLLANSRTWKLLFTTTTLIHIVSAAGGCYLENSDGIQLALAQSPCSSNGGIQVCCNIGDTCGGEDSICRRNTAVTLPAALTSTSLIRASSTATIPTSSFVAVTSSTVAQVTPQPTSSAVVRTGSIYTISSISLPILPSIPFPANLNILPRQSTADENFYVGGCTDSSYNSSECSNHCTGYSMQNIIYNSATNSWSCCGDTFADCSAPTSETFAAIAPSSFDAVSSIPPAIASSIASAAVASATSATNNTSPSSSGLSHGALAGIIFAVVIPVIFVLAAAIGFCLRKRKMKAHKRARIDHALVEELTGRMRSIESWYGGLHLRGNSSNSSNLFTMTNGSGGVDAPGHTFAYETPVGLREVKVREQPAATKKIPLQLQLARLQFSRGVKRGVRNLSKRNPSGVIVSPQNNEVSSPIGRFDGGGRDLGPSRENLNSVEEMEGSMTGIWPLAMTLHRPWEFQRSVVSLREMDGTGISPLEQRQSEETDEGSYEDVTVNTGTTGGSGWEVRRPWQIQRPPSSKGLDGTGRLSLPAW